MGVFALAEPQKKSDAGPALFCSVCASPISAADEPASVDRRCPHCGSLERQRVIADILKGPSPPVSLSGSRVLLIAPSASEARLLAGLAVGEVVKADIASRAPGMPVIDPADMADFQDGTFDAVFATSILANVVDLARSLAEIARVLKPGGAFLCADRPAPGKRTQELVVLDSAQTAGGPQPAASRVAVHRRLGEEDFEATLALRFAVERISATDHVTGTPVAWYVARKAPAAKPAPDVVAPQVAKRPPATPAGLRVVGCPICGNRLGELVEGEKCPTCHSPPRLRSLVPLVSDVVAPALKDSPVAGTLPLLAFAMTSEERRIVERVFPSSKSVSLFGSYAADHESGVDARDLSRYPDDSFSGHFSVLLFDYFHEHQKALYEAFRVTAPGGMLITHIAQYRLVDGDAAPSVKKKVVGRPGYFDYMPAGATLDDIVVGRDWFLKAMERAGFLARVVKIEDAATGLSLDWFIGVKPASAKADPPPADGRTTPLFLVRGCPLCGTAGPVFAGASEACPGCSATARARSLAPIVTDLMRRALPLADALEKPILAFSATRDETPLLRRLFPRLKSVSLYGEYGDSHEEGVDARDLSRYAADSFSGVFGIGLFDFFEEHGKALAEAFRVTAPGGVFLTLLLPYRLRDDDDPPRTEHIIVRRADYFDYMPEGASLPSITVGRRWFLKAITRAGFAAETIVVHDEGSGIDFHWFVGIKPGRDYRPPHRPARPPVETPPAAPAIVKASAPPIEKVISTPVDPATGFKRVVVRLTVPSVPAVARSADFAHHHFDTRMQESTDTVFAVQAGGVLVSEDCGDHWEFVPTPETGAIRLFNAFKTGAGTVLLQGFAPHGPKDARGTADTDAPLFVCDANLRVIDRLQPGRCNWHGTRSIDEANGTIIYAEYPENSSKYLSDFAAREAELLPLCDDAGVFRSTDGGRSWAKVMEQSWRRIRHFHTAVADPHRPGTWMVSSGDGPQECLMWRSEDDGLTWSELGLDAGSVALHPAIPRRDYGVIKRHTDMAVLPDALIWGADDLLGPLALFDDPSATLRNRVGSRVFISPKGGRLAPEVVGYVGSHIRSLIDTGPAYLVMTEAKYPTVTARPQVSLLTKAEPRKLVPLFTVDRYRSTGSGFTHSRSSRSARSGRFFTYREHEDAFPGGARILQWDVEYE